MALLNHFPALDKYGRSGRSWLVAASIAMITACGGGDGAIAPPPDGSTVLVNTKFSFTPADQRVYQVALADGRSYTNTRTVLAVLGNEVERLQNTYSNGDASSVNVYDSEVRGTSFEIPSRAYSCTYSPPRVIPASLEAGRLTVGGSISQTVSTSCRDATQTFPPSSSNRVLTLTGTGTGNITTPAGTFANTKIWTLVTTVSGTSNSVRDVLWHEPVMNMPVRETRYSTVSGVETLLSTGELTSFSIKNYPK